MGSFLLPMCDYTLGFEDWNSYFPHFSVIMKHHLLHLFIEQKYELRPSVCKSENENQIDI